MWIALDGGSYTGLGLHVEKQSRTWGGISRGDTASESC